jgi:hypothetical protein
VEASGHPVLPADTRPAPRRGIKADVVAVEALRDLLDARSVRVVRGGPEGDLVVAQAGQSTNDLDLDRLPHLDEEGRIPSGHRRSVGGTLVLPAEGAVVDLVRRDRRVGALVIVPAEDRPILRETRLGIAAIAHALANAR